MKSEKKALQAAFHKDLILRAAEKLFMQKGTENTLMDEIAKEAGYSKSTVYVYFKSKEEIYHHILYRGMLTLKERFAQALDTKKSFDNQFYALCFALDSFCEDYPLHFDGILSPISLDFSSRDEKDILYLIFTEGEEINRLIGSLLSGAIESGETFNGLKLKETIFTLWAGISGLVRMAGQKKDYISSQMGIDRPAFLRYGFSLLLRAIKSNKTTEARL